MAISDFWLQKLSSSLRTKLNVSSEPDRSGRVIIEHQPLVSERIISKLNNYGGRIHREIGFIPSLAVELPGEVIPEFAKMMGVIKIWEDTPVYCMQNRSLTTPGATSLLDNSSFVNDGSLIDAPSLIDANDAHETGYTGKGVVVALLDTGIFPHEDLTSPENRILAWSDLIHQKPVPYDDNGHGTHIAGIIAGNGVSGSGKYRGIAPEALLVGIKVLDQDGIGRLSDLLAGLEWCYLHQSALNIKVINLSLGTTAQAHYYQDPLCRAATKLVQQGITICAANEGGTGPEIQPACFLNAPGINPQVINVGSFNNQKTLTGAEISRFKNSIPGSVSNIPDLVTPGNELTSLKTGGNYQTLSGVSLAAPLASGAIALILQKWPGLNPERIKWLLKKTTRNLGVGVNLQGAGLLNLERIFTARKKPKKIELSGNAAPEVLQVLLNVIGSSLSHTGDSGPSGNLLSSLLLSFLKNLK